MQNTISTNANRVEIMMGNRKEMANMISSVENSSTDGNQMNPKLDYLVRVKEQDASKIDAEKQGSSSAQPELAHPPQETAENMGEAHPADYYASAETHKMLLPNINKEKKQK